MYVRDNPIKRCTKQNDTAEPASAPEIYPSVLCSGRDGPTASDAGHERANAGDYQQRHPIVRAMNGRLCGSLQIYSWYQNPKV